ncbi:MAG: hypothetical protein IT168_04030 [Bryobacterales bacterium]|nr:hypothetical protein [Bryobacterales bacterium]
MTNRSGRSAALYLLLTFLSGVAVGSLGFWLYATKTVSAVTTKGSDEFRRRYMDEMETRLKLSGDQKQRLTTILDQTRTLYREVYEKHRPEYDAIQEHQVSQIRGILTPDQQQEYEKIRKERAERRKRAPY